MQKSVHSDEYRVLREELRRARADAALSQRDLAERLEVPHTWVAKVESGERRIDLIEFLWFMSACGSDPLRPIARLKANSGRIQSGRGKK